MKLQIDNFDGRGLQDYTAAIDVTRLPRVVRRGNNPWVLKVSLVANQPDFVVPVKGAHIMFGRTNGQDVFTGYLIAPPTYEYLGWGEKGPAFRYDLIAHSDEILLDRKRLPNRSPFAARSAGEALRQVTQDLLPGGFDLSAVQDLDVLSSYKVDPQKKWSQHAAEIALQARACYRAENGKLVFSPVGANVYKLDENDGHFSPDGLRLEAVDRTVNDVTVIGEIEPQTYVKDYFVGDGLTMKFYLSQSPHTKYSQVLFTEEFNGTAPDPTRWDTTDPVHIISVADGALQISGGTGIDGQTIIKFVEQIELGDALVLQHGDVTFTGASAGVVGGLYAGSVSIAECLAGFRSTPNGRESNIQAIINGSVTGPSLTTLPSHHYQFTTRFYAPETHRRQQIYHSSSHSAGQALGGASIPTNVRLVLEVQDIDPASPASMVAPAVVLYDGTIPQAPDYCTYALVNAVNLHCSVSFTALVQAVNAEVRSMLPNQSYRTRLVGALADGAECTIISGPALDFFSQYVPALNELIEVHYRGAGRATARVTDSVAAAAQARGSDDGVRAVVRRVKSPSARTTTDCENAALAMLDDGTVDGWKGQYETWSDFLPGGAPDVFPGDGLQVNVPSRAAVFLGIVRDVEIDVKDLFDEHSQYKISFSDAGADDLSFEFETGQVALPVDLPVLAASEVGTAFLVSLTAARLTEVTSTTVTIDAGVTPPSGGGIEIRWSDFGWGQGNDRNLAGRFTSQQFTLPRFSKGEDYFLRQYDASAPPKYSRYSVALHVFYPY